MTQAAHTARRPSKAQRDAMVANLAAACEAQLPWLDELVRAAGYGRPDDGIPQSVLVAAVPKLTGTTLRNWENAGLPSERRGRRKLYKPLELIVYLCDRFVGPGRPRDGGGDASDLVAAQTRATHLQADLREIQKGERLGELRERADAERLMVALVLEARSALLGMPGTLAPQLEHQPAPVIRDVLDRHVRWVCRELRKGRVHVPPDAAERIREAIRDVTAPPKPPKRKRGPARRPGASGPPPAPEPRDGPDTPSIAPAAHLAARPTLSLYAPFLLKLRTQRIGQLLVRDLVCGVAAHFDDD